MRVLQIHLPVAREPAHIRAALAHLQAIEPQLLLVFFTAERLADGAFTALLAEAFPGALRIGCSTAGEIVGEEVCEGSIVVTAVHFDATTVREVTTELACMADSGAAGERLAAQLPGEGLRAVLVFAQGVAINGSALVAGMSRQLPPGVAVSGGLAGDGGAFSRTWVLSSQGVAEHRVVAVGLYGQALRVGHGSFGGWEPFGPARKVTRCENNVLYELDGEPALDIYKRYLGEYARDLPASGLLFPFSMADKDRSSVGLIRTILGVDEASGSLILAGEIDPDGYLKLMHANPNALVDGAQRAAEMARAMVPGEALAILVSCVGRKLVLGGRVDEEVEAVADVFGRNCTLTGFYSYGEISPFNAAPGAVGPDSCRLHNQTMTITLLTEV